MNLLSAIAEIFCSERGNTQTARTATLSDHDADVYKEQMAELRWRRDQDRNYLTLFIAVCAFCVPGFYILLSKAIAPNVSVWLLLAPIPIVVFAAALSCTVKLNEENKNYELTARTVIRVLDKWDMIAQADSELLRNTSGEIEKPATPGPLYNFNSGIRKLGSGGEWERVSG